MVSIYKHQHCSRADKFVSICVKRQLKVKKIKFVYSNTAKLESWRSEMVQFRVLSHKKRPDSTFWVTEVECFRFLSHYKWTDSAFWVYKDGPIPHFKSGLLWENSPIFLYFCFNSDWIKILSMQFWSEKHPL